MDPPPPPPSFPSITNVIQIRSKSGIFKPKTYATMVNTDPDFIHTVPTTVTQALATKHWKNAMLDEYFALTKNQIWTLVSALADSE